MEINKILTSGILEQYVLGDLSSTEVNQVEQYIQEYPKVKAEIEQIEAALEAYAHSAAIQPNPSLEASILYKILEEEPNAPTSSSSTNAPKVNPLYPIAAIAGGALLIGSLFWGYTQSQQLQNSQNQLSGITDEYELLKEDCSKLQAIYQTKQEHIAFLQDFSTQPIIMKGTEKAPNAVAAVYWNTDMKKSYLNTSNMPDLATDKQYQLWAIVDGKPVDMGVFDVAITTEQLIEVPFIDSPQAFAVTIERKGGSPTPTLEEMVVIGENS